MTEDPRLPAQKQNTKFMLAYCRKYIPGFADMHDRAKASKLVSAKAQPARAKGGKR